jgi:3-hydroxyacyl-[acyl-carrier-protein] dehydratase
MKFQLVDHVISLQPGSSIVAVKNLSLAEEYLADHFPGFPVLPGVLMLEASVQSAAWLVHHTLNFSHSMIVLKEARGVRYGSFVRPGQQLVIHADAVKISDNSSDFKIRGMVGQVTAIQARLTLSHLNLAVSDPSLGPLDDQILAHLKARWQQLFDPAANAVTIH